MELLSRWELPVCDSERGLALLRMKLCLLNFIPQSRRLNCLFPCRSPRMLLPQIFWLLLVWVLRKKKKNLWSLGIYLSGRKPAEQTNGPEFYPQLWSREKEEGKGRDKAYGGIVSGFTYNWNVYLNMRRLSHLILSNERSFICVSPEWEAGAPNVLETWAHHLRVSCSDFVRLPFVLDLILEVSPYSELELLKFFN